VTADTYVNTVARRRRRITTNTVYIFLDLGIRGFPERHVTHRWLYYLSSLSASYYSVLGKTAVVFEPKQYGDGHTHTYTPPMIVFALRLRKAENYRLPDTAITAITAEITDSKRAIVTYKLISPPSIQPLNVVNYFRNCETSATASHTPPVVPLNAWRLVRVA